MISPAQEKTLSAKARVGKRPKLSALEKAMLKWVVVEPEDRLLDASIGSGMMAEYLRRNMQCEVCGVSDNMDHVRQARSRLRSCDIVYAVAGDIPWREDAFDIVMLKYRGEDSHTLGRMLSEASRVLRPGGQLILGAVSYPRPISALAGLLADESLEERRCFRRAEAEEMLKGFSFEKATWHRASLTTRVMIAWKRKPDVGRMRDQS